MRRMASKRRPTTPPPSAFIWQLPGWPNLAFDPQACAGDLTQARLQQGRLLGLLDAIGLDGARHISQTLWVQEAVATAAIEGERLDLDAVRSSVFRRLGLADKRTPDRHVDGLVEVMQDATEGYQAVLDEDRLCRWQSALFPGGTSGIRRIAVGRYRDHADPMQIVSGILGREVVHHTAPPSRQVGQEMAQFLEWFEGTRPKRGLAAGASPALDGLVRAALAHLWFEVVHPFEDGNGRLGRAIVDMAIAQDMDSPIRVFGLSRQMLDSRAAYYDALTQAERGGLDVTPWVRWFLQAFIGSCLTAQAVVKQAVDKAAFRLRAAAFTTNERQAKVLNRLLESGDGGFLGGMTADKYSKITGASKATSTRDLQDLLGKDLLVVQGQGKATRYALNVDGWNRQDVEDPASR
jgi:Fic family protein